MRTYLLNIKDRNPSFSLRSLAKKLQINPGGLSLFLNSKKDFSLEILEKIMTLVIDDPNEWYEFKRNYLLQEKILYYQSELELLMKCPVKLDISIQDIEKTK